MLSMNAMFYIDQDKLGFVFMFSLCLGLLFVVALEILLPKFLSKRRDATKDLNIDKGEQTVLAFVVFGIAILLIAIFTLLTREPVNHYHFIITSTQ